MALYWVGLLLYHFGVFLLAHQLHLPVKMKMVEDEDEDSHCLCENTSNSCQAETAAVLNCSCCAILATIGREKVEVSQQK